MHKIDLLGIGNSMLDRYFTVHENDLEKMNLRKGSVGLITDSERQMYLDQSPEHTVPGGSVSNSIATASLLGCTSSFVTVLGNDDTGERYIKGLTFEGIDFNVPLDPHHASGFCNVYVTADGERTMRTYLGASSTLSVDHLSQTARQKPSLAFLEGYLFANPNGVNNLTRMAQYLKENNIKIALTGSAAFVIHAFQAEMLSFIYEFVDIFFANEEEAHALLNDNNLDNLTSLAPHSVITCGARGVAVQLNAEQRLYPAYPHVEVVDTTGAGDAFAGAYLKAYLNHETPEVCVSTGQKAACHVIQRFGARPDSKLRASMNMHNV
jgi:sugar/nucleoside kinase (ribokinase family)